MHPQPGFPGGRWMISSNLYKESSTLFTVVACVVPCPLDICTIFGINKWQASKYISSQILKHADCYITVSFHLKTVSA